MIKVILKVTMGAICSILSVTHFRPYSSLFQYFTLFYHYKETSQLIYKEDQLNGFYVLEQRCIELK